MFNIFHRHKMISGFGPKYERAVRNYLLQKSFDHDNLCSFNICCRCSKSRCIKNILYFWPPDRKVCLVLICPMSLICEENITDVRRLGKKVEHFQRNNSELLPYSYKDFKIVFF